MNAGVSRRKFTVSKDFTSDVVFISQGDYSQNIK